MNALQIKKLERLQERLKQNTSPIVVGAELVINGMGYDLGCNQVFGDDSTVCFYLMKRDSKNDYRINLRFDRR